MKRKAILITLLLLLLLAHGVQAMSSPNYTLNWYTLLSSNGGDTANSTHFAANFTVGQTVIGAVANTSNSVGLGYWYGLQPFRVRLPLVTRP